VPGTDFKSLTYHRAMDRRLQRVCVYCASSPGFDDKHRDNAAAFGRELVTRNIGLVYGGGHVGLMGVIADSVMDAGGEVVGVIPSKLFSREVAHQGLTQLIEVSSMHERKQKMFELADAFVALPGGLGTLEELFEVATWSQLGLHAKPIVVLDTDGYYQPLADLITNSVDAGLMRPANGSIIKIVEAVDELLPAIRSYERESVPKLIEVAET